MLALEGSAQLNGTSEVNINTGAALNLTDSAQINSGTIVINGGTLRQNSSAWLSLPVSFDGVNGGTITGTGVIDVTGCGGLTVGNNAVLSPGNSPGVQTYYGTIAWAPEGTYHWEIADWTGIASNDWDYIPLNGDLDLSMLDSNSRFTIEIAGLGLGQVPDNFERSVDKAFPILSTGPLGINPTLGPDMFMVTGAGFAGGASYMSWSIYQEGNTLWLQYTALIPESTTAMLLGLGGLLLLVGRRIKRARS